MPNQMDETLYHHLVGAYHVIAYVQLLLLKNIIVCNLGLKKGNGTLSRSTHFYLVSLSLFVLESRMITKFATCQVNVFKQYIEQEFFQKSIFSTGRPSLNTDCYVLQKLTTILLS